MQKSIRTSRKRKAAVRTAAKPLPRDLHAVVREVCLWMPEAEEFSSHGSPNFRVSGKTYATYVVNHHGDGRVALWLNMPAGAQDLYVKNEPKHFFVPPYVGPRGWLGVHLNKGIAWSRVTQLVREAYEKVAPSRLSALLGKTPSVKAPTKTLRPEDIDPLRAPAAQALHKGLRDICLALPEVSETLQFGAPMWKAGKRSFVGIHAFNERKQAAMTFWVGVEQQALLTADSRFTVPSYLGHLGWIAFQPGKRCNWDEVRALVLQSYRHFATQRMLKAMLKA